MIPVGYLTKLAMDIEEGDYVKLIGKILEIELGEDELFHDQYTDEPYMASTVVVKTPSVVAGRFIFTTIPLDYEIQILSYAKVK